MRVFPRRTGSKNWVLAIFFLGCVSIVNLCCNKHSNNELANTANHLKYFGFTLIDAGWDDPLDRIEKTNYVDEVASFSNMADILVLSPTDTLLTRLSSMSGSGMKAILHLSGIFFEYVGTGAPSGSMYRLRTDYKIRWDQLMKINNLVVNDEMLQAFYVGEEPTWNGITYDQLKAATDYVKATVPDVPVMIVEAYPALASLQIPPSADWCGFDHYFIKDPKNSDIYLSELALLKSKKSANTQQFVLVMDAQYIPALDSEAGRISETDMKTIATGYFDLARSDTSIIGLLGYCWPGGFDDPTAKGARDLPQTVQDEYRRIGRIISGK